MDSLRVNEGSNRKNPISRESEPILPGLLIRYGKHIRSNDCFDQTRCDRIAVRIPDYWPITTPGITNNPHKDAI
jgi:hypothetical protein